MVRSKLRMGWYVAIAIAVLLCMGCGDGSDGSGDSGGGPSSDFTFEKATGTITNYKGPGGAVTIPSTINGVPVTAIGGAAFSYWSSLTSVTIPNSVTTIGQGAFCKSGLTSVTIPDSVTSIGSGAFEGCTSLTSITIPNSVASIGERVFLDCRSLTSVTIPNSVTSIGNYAFYAATSLTSVTIGNSVASIGECAFFNCSSLTSVTIPNSVTSIGNYAFYAATSLTSVTFQGTITEANFAAGSSSLPTFPGDLRDKYLATGGGVGTYTRSSGSTWTKLFIVEYDLGNTGPGGGKIFYISAEGFTMTDTGEICHYLEAATADMTLLAWTDTLFLYDPPFISSTSFAIGGGRKNTALILAAEAAAPAALACKNYLGGGKNDWFLPSLDELVQLATYKAFVGNFEAEFYWSSSEYDTYNAFRKDFTTGAQSGESKRLRATVRAIRAF